MDILATIIAALGHDIAHPAFTNRFLVNNHDIIAIRYNDQSPLENMHSSTIFEILSNKKCNILKNLPK